MRTDETHDGGRRRFLRNALGAGGAAIVAPSCGASPAAPETAQRAAPPSPAAEPAAGPTLPGIADADLEHLIVHGVDPLVVETRRAAVGSGVVTPSSRLFVRNNLPMPAADVVAVGDAWRVAVEGVAQAREIGLAELKTLGLTTVAAVLQCSGNGRSWFPHGASGTQWSVGAAGCVVWTGVPMRTVAEHLGGPAPGARFLTTTGAEELPADVEPDRALPERSIPLEKAMEDCLLAWELNGEPIGRVHGGPVRLIVPGYYGCNNIKWVRKLAFTPAESGARMMRSSYRVRPVGESGAPEQPTMWKMNVKSWVLRPSSFESVPAGRVWLMGVAFSGGAPIRRVEVSIDGGAAWRDAELVGPDLGPFAWRQFALPWDAEPGEHVIASRATDAEGETQPEGRADNERGYAHNGWRDHALPLSVCAADVAECNEREAPPSPAFADTGGGADVVLSPQAEEGRRIFTEVAEPSCGSCHTLSNAGTTASIGPDLDQSRQSREQILSAVQNGVGVMPAMRGRLTDEQIRAVAQYLLEATGRR